MNNDFTKLYIEDAKIKVNEVYYIKNKLFSLSLSNDKKNCKCKGGALWARDKEKY